MALPVWKTDCGCTQEVAMGAKRKRFCKHGRLFERVREDGSTVRSLSYSGEPDRDWTDARAKVEEEGCCRICKRTDRKLEAAHILGREHDEPKVSKRNGETLKELYVHPDRIVPLCGPFPEGCHGDVDHNRVNLVHHLTIAEQVQAVKDAGGIAPAWVALAPVGPGQDHTEEIARTLASFKQEVE
jgi:hypothetical protein